MSIDIRKKLLFLSTLLFVAGCNNEQQIVGSGVLGFAGASTEAQVVKLVDPQSMSVELKVFAQTKCDLNVMVSFGVDDSKVAQYNAANGTDYEVAPVGSYTFADTGAMLPRYNEESTPSSIKLMSEALPDAKPYLLPIVIDEVSSYEGDCSKIKMSAEMGVKYILFSKYDLPEAVELDRTDWKAIYASCTRAGDLYKLENTFDGDLSTRWNYNWGASFILPVIAIVDMGEEYTIRGGEFKAATSDSNETFNANTPMNVAISTTCETVTADNWETVDWGESENFDDTILEWPNSEYGFADIRRGRYVKFEFNAFYDSDGVGSKNGFVVGEIIMLGNEEVLDLD